MASKVYDRFLRACPLWLQIVFREQCLSAQELSDEKFKSVLKKLASNDVTLNEGDVNLNDAISGNESWDSSDDEPINKIVEETKRKSSAKMKNEIEQAKSSLSNEMKNDTVSKNRDEIVTRKKLFSSEELPSTSHSAYNKLIYNTQTFSGPKRSCGQVLHPKKLIPEATKRKEEQSLGRNLTSSTIPKPPLIVKLCNDGNGEMMELSSNMSQTPRKIVHKLTDVNAVKTLKQTICSVDDIAPHCSVGTARVKRSLPNLNLAKAKNRQKLFAKNFMNKSGTSKQLRLVDGNFRNLIAKATKADSTPNENQQHLVCLESSFSQQPTLSGRHGGSNNRHADANVPDFDLVVSKWGSSSNVGQCQSLGLFRTTFGNNRMLVLIVDAKLLINR
uniref:Uncharacterized protein n=1 Tax=Glossina austeni TaxID=7395 RepID=A0A1A9VSP0_GLOAU